MCFKNQFLLVQVQLIMEFFACREKTSLFWLPSQDFVRANGFFLRKKFSDSETVVLCQDYQSHLAALSGQASRKYSETPVQRKTLQVNVALNPDEWNSASDFSYFDPLTFVKLDPILENDQIRYASSIGDDYPMNNSGFRSVSADQDSEALQSTKVMIWKSESFVLILKR